MLPFGCAQGKLPQHEKAFVLYKGFQSFECWKPLRG